MYTTDSCEQYKQAFILTLHWKWTLFFSFHISVCRDWPGNTGFTNRTYQKKKGTNRLYIIDIITDKSNAFNKAYMRKNCT